jgi:hypothetical protein
LSLGHAERTGQQPTQQSEGSMSADFIQSRTTIDNKTIWLVTADERGLGLESCRCGQSVVAALTKYHGAVIEVEFSHEESHCRAAFDRKDFKPLTWPEYQKLMGVEVEDAELDR